MTLAEVLQLGLAALTILIILGGMLKFYFKSETQSKVMDERLKGHIDSIKKDIRRLEENGLRHLKELHKDCMAARVAAEQELNDKLSDLIEDVIALKVKNKERNKEKGG